MTIVFIVKRKPEARQCFPRKFSLIKACLRSGSERAGKLPCKIGNCSKRVGEEIFASLVTLPENMQDLQPGRLFVIEQVLNTC